ARRENRQLAPAPQILEDIEGTPAILSGCEHFLWLDEIDEMVRNSALLGGRDFRCSYIEMPVDLRRIANKDFSAESLGEPDPESRFARSVRPENHYEPREIAHPENFQYRSKRASNTSTASRRAPTTCVRFSFNGG